MVCAYDIINICGVAIRNNIQISITSPHILYQNFNYI